MEKNPPNWELIVLRYFETLEKIAHGKASKIFLPLETQMHTKEFFKQLFGIESMDREEQFIVKDLGNESPSLE